MEEIYGNGLDSLFAKYNVVCVGTTRIYGHSLADRSWNVENTAPFCVVVNGELELWDRAWSKIVKGIVQYLQATYPIDKEILYQYRTEWSKAQVFGKEKFIINSEKICEDLYVSINFTAVHSVWFIQDMLKLYNVDLNKCFLLIHRPPEREPKEIRDTIKNVVTDAFKFFLKEKGKDDSTIESIMKIFEVINKVQAKISKSYSDFFLMDSTLVVANWKSKLLINYPKFISWSDKQVRMVKKVLDYYTEFYGDVSKTIKKNMNRINMVTPSGCIVQLDLSKGMEIE